MEPMIVVVGGGRMGSALVGGLLASGHPAARLRVSEPDPAQGARLRKQHGVNVAAGAPALGDADAMVLAVKPQDLRAAAQGLRPAARTTVLSVAAGVRIASLREWLGPDAPIVRCMPNTAALVRQGAIGAHAPPGTPDAALALAERILGSVGRVCWVREEAELDAVTALSGSGPAYYFLVTEILQQAAEALGLERDTARRLAEQTLVGSAHLVGAGGKDAAGLRADVTSRGGTTEAALAHLERHGVRELFAGALRAARDRAAELGAPPAGH